MWAAEHGRDKAVEVLLSNNADVQMTDEINKQALSYAIANGHERTANLLLDKQAIPNNRSNQNGKNDLMLAVSTMSLATIERMVTAGADPSFQDKSGHDALWYAIDASDAAVVALLIENFSANLGHKDKDGLTLLHRAASMNQTEAADMLLQKGAPINAVANDGNTPLMMAASRGNAETVRLLVASGADINNKNDIGNTALILSVLADSVESVGLLLDAGADIDIRNNKREQALHLAELSDNSSIIRLLQKYKQENRLFGIF